jgi:hypothetical protein
MNVEMGTENAQFLFWEYLIPVSGVVSLNKLKFIFEELLCICPLSNYGVFIFDANQAQINSVDDDRTRRKERQLRWTNGPRDFEDEIILKMYTLTSRLINSYWRSNKIWKKQRILGQKKSRGKGLQSASGWSMEMDKG